MKNRGEGFPLRGQTTDKLCYKSNSSLNSTNIKIHFSFDTIGAKEKFPKENAV